MRQERCVEQFYPSNKYTIDEIKKELSHKIKFYPKKKTDIEITLNENGLYVARISFLFEENLNLKERWKSSKKSMAVKKNIHKETDKKKWKKTKYEKHMEKNIILRPI